MSQASPTQGRPHTKDHGQGTIVRLGGWLFRYRTAIAVPFAAAILLLGPETVGPLALLVTGAGLMLTLAGELVRLWAIRYIGAISRTRSERLGPLVATGPFALIRNPLYVGNIALWVGFAMAARLTWGAALIGLLLAGEYHAIVGWEEELLESRVGEAYRRYSSQVPRWIPRLLRVPDHAATDDAPNPSPKTLSTLFSWGDTFFSERGTLIAILLGYVLLWAKAIVQGA
jgi:protein-S-isoprenylcysteine O-methyltransferase Ste14